MGRAFPPLDQTVLIVESNAVIGIDVADYLEVEGYTVAGPFACEGALGWLSTHTPRAALLDVDLQSGACVDLARELHRRAVPILVFSAHDRRFALPEFRDVPWVPLPSPFTAIGSTLNGLLAADGAVVQSARRIARTTDATGR